MGSGSRAAGALAAFAAVLALASPAAADVPPGFDLFETDPEATVFSFREEFTIPPNFFDQGSPPFQGDVRLGGRPLGTFQGRDVGDADTIVRRPVPADLDPPFPRTAEIPIELVALSLQSIAPIEVRVGQTTQLWDVHAEPSPTRTSQGGLRIVQAGPEGGTLESFLEVIPRFTFTRLSDGAQRSLDLGASGPGSLRKLFTSAQDVPWRSGCIAPALLLPGLNPDFCPGLTPNPRKVLTPRRGALVSHGVLPAQHRTEHFKCYRTASRPAFRPLTASLTDQFLTQRVRVVSAAELCNPVQKGKEPLVNRRAHLRCYGIRQLAPSFSARSALVRNQFGSQLLSVGAPRALCLPTRKGPLTRREPPSLAVVPDHFKCYRVQPRTPFAVRTVGLRDQFESRRSRVIKPVLLCNPAQKRVGRRTTPIQHPVHHLVCYSIRDAVRRRTVPARVVIARNQFHRVVARTGRPTGLCVPSLKLPAS